MFNMWCLKKPSKVLKAAVRHCSVRCWWKGETRPLQMSCDLCHHIDGSSRCKRVTLDTGHTQLLTCLKCLNESLNSGEAACRVRKVQLFVWFKHWIFTQRMQNLTIFKPNQIVNLPLHYCIVTVKMEVAWRIVTMTTKLPQLCPSLPV